jgi:hypothetical protein
VVNQHPVTVKTVRIKWQALHDLWTRWSLGLKEQDNFGGVLRFYRAMALLNFQQRPAGFAPGGVFDQGFKPQARVWG